MLNEILIGGGIATVSGVVGFLISKKLIISSFEIYTDQAKAKASAIENEAHLLLEKSNSKAHEIQIAAAKEYEQAKEKAKADLHQREDDVLRKEQSFKRYKQNEEEKLQEENTRLKTQLINLKRNEKSLDALKLKYEQKIDEALNSIENCSGMTKEEAKVILLEKIEEKSREDIAHIVRKYEVKAKKEAQENANYILAQATSRFAGEFAS